MSVPETPAATSRAHRGDRDGVVSWFSDATAFDVLSRPMWEPVSAAAVAAARPAPGERVLDACAGAGASALPLARAVGPSGRVDAVDLSAPLLGLAASRAAAEGLHQLRTHVADVLAFGEPGTYDLVVSVMGVFFLPDVDAGGRHLAGLLRPGGRLCASVWAEGSMREVLPPLAALAARARGEEPTGAPGSSAAAELSTPAGLTGWAERAGVVDVEVVRAPLRVALTEERVRALVEGTAARALLRGLDAAARAEVAGELAAVLGPGAELTAASLVLTGRRP